jgi:lipopolysaccharide export system protein LptA
VTLRSEGGTTKPSKTAPSNAPSQVQTIEATGNVLLQQPGRRATGTHLVYTDDEEKFVLTGSPGIPPSIFDAEHGQVTGVSLTFFTRDDRVLVDSSNSISITQTRLKK